MTRVRVPFDDAELYQQHGWSGVLALPARAKTPPEEGFTGADGRWPLPADLARWREEGKTNLAIRLPHGVIGLDVDCYDGKPGRETLLELCQKLGAPPKTWTSTSRSDGSGIRWYRVPADVRDWPSEAGPGIEIIRYGHRYSMVGPSIHPDGRHYVWIRPDGTRADPGEVPKPGDLPELPASWVWHLTGVDPETGEATTRPGSRAGLHERRAKAQEWIDGLPDGEPCERTAAVAVDLYAAARREDGNAYDHTRDAMLALLRMGEQGHVGVPGVIEQGLELYVRTVSDKRDARTATAEYERFTLDGAAKILETPSGFSWGCDCGDAPRVHEPERQTDSASADSEDDWPETPRVPGPPEPERIPLDGLPDVLYKTIRTVADGTQTAQEFVAWQAFGCISAALRGRYDVRVDDRPWIETGVLDPIPILPTGARKSPPFKLLTRAIARWELDQRDQLEALRRYALDRVRHLKQALDREIKKAGDGLEAENHIKKARDALTKAERDVPVLPRVRVGDTTSEALALLMRDQGGAIALLAPEGDPLKVLAGRYDEGHHARLELLKQGYDREAFIRDRVGEREDPIYIASPVLTVALSMQPGVIDALQNRDVFRYEGVLARFLWCVPPHGLGRRKTGTDVPQVNMDALGGYSAALRRLLDLPMPDEPIVLDLTGEAREAVYEYEGWIEARIGDDGELEPIRDWMAKAVGKAVRLALLLEQFARAADPAATDAELETPIGTYISAALRICQAATSHAFHVLAGMDIDAGTRDQRYVLSRACVLPEGSTLRDLFNACDQHRAIETMENLRPIIWKLCDRGCLRLRPQPPTGGRPASPIVEIHPTLRTTGAKDAKGQAGGASAPYAPTARRVEVKNETQA